MPPFRAEHVGSFPRPERLMAAREAFAAGKLAKEGLRRVETDCIREIVALQERVGIGVVTDGEFRRSSWRDFVFEKCDGFGAERGGGDFAFKLFDGTVRKAAGVPPIVGRLSRREPFSAEDFSLLKPMTRRPIKANLPTPSSMHYQSGDVSIAKTAYPDRRAFLDDLTRLYREEIADLAARGCTYLQMDEVPLAVICDPANREIVKARGEDPDELIDDYVDAINASIRDRPAGMTVCVHMCRGNIGHGMADGGYEPVAERMFGRLEVDGYFLEYDTPRAGDFSPLRFAPKDKLIVLGLLTTKTPENDSKDTLKRRIDEAAKYVPLECLALSPQCGFASVAKGNPITVDDQRRKLALIVETADEVWGRG
jgi:5-methyltetrahydropteroyltriglutamate--homocysteine methyltransferase